MLKTRLLLAFAAFALAPLSAHAFVYKAWKSGLYFAQEPPGYQAQAGEVIFDHQPKPSDLTAAFPGYTAAVNAQQASAQLSAKLNAGFVVSCAANATTCTGTIAGTYAVDATSQFNITAETVSILTNNTFTNGQATRNWPDSSGAYHSFTVAQFKEFATAVAAYVDGLQTTARLLASGQSSSWPTASASMQ